MKKLLLFFSLYLMMGLACSGQNFEWAKNAYGTLSVFLTRDNSGNLYTANGGVSKYDPSGILLWHKPMTNFTIKGLAADQSGNLYVTGLFSGTVTLDGFTLTADPGNLNLYLAKLNPAGTTEWISRSHNSAWFSNNISADALTVDAQGNPIIIGRFLDSLKLDSFIFDAPETNQLFLAKYTPSGVCIWAKHLVSGTFNGGDNGPELKADRLGNTYIFGHYIGDSAIFDGFHIYPYHYGSYYGSDLFLAKLDVTGNFLWVKNIGGQGYEESGAMDVDSTGNVYLSAYFDTEVHCDSIILTTSWETFFTAKYSPDGSCIWARKGNTPSFCATNDGYYTSSPSLISKYDGEGALQWTKAVPNAANWGMTAHGNEVYITGNYIPSATFEAFTVSSSTGSNQAYLAKISTTVASIKEEQVKDNFTVSPNPAGSLISITGDLSSQRTKLLVRNASGASIYSEVIEGAGPFSRQINLAAYSKGLYTVELQQGKKRQVKKLVLQ
jgi:hypothetical protein